MVSSLWLTKKIDLNNICECKSSNEIVPVGIGTERIEKKAKELFPKSKIMRIDSDTIKNVSQLNDFINKSKNAEIDILIGTQMLAKGHDFPNLTLVGIIDIDSGLYSLDFRGIEKIAQMIIQVAGRSGRHSTQGKLIIQTRKPNHPIMTKLLENGYNDFANAVWEIFSRIHQLIKSWIIPENIKSTSTVGTGNPFRTL